MKSSPYRAAAVGAAVLLCCQFGAAVAAPLVFTANLTGSQVATPGPTSSTATGNATVVLDELTNTDYTVTTDFVWNGLSGPADRSHLHSAPPGQPTNGDFFHEVLYIWWPSDIQGPSVSCVIGGTTTTCVPATGSTHDVLHVDSSNIVSYVDFATLVSLFETGGMYIDIHNDQYPDGEIRGQFAADPIPEPAGLGLLALAGTLAASLCRSGRRR